MSNVLLQNVTRGQQNLHEKKRGKYDGTVGWQNHRGKIKNTITFFFFSS